MTQPLLSLLQHGNQLKRTQRTGWGQRGVPNPENVAAHTFGMSFTALVLATAVAEEVGQPLDLGKLLTLALLHDLPEGLTTDIPAPAWRFLPPGIKHEVERLAMVEIVGDTAVGAELLKAWAELDENSASPEVRLVHDADKLDMYLQAYLYEQQTGNQQLAEFWRPPHRFHYQVCQAIYDSLCALRAGE